MKTGGFKWWHGVVFAAAVAALAWGAYSTFGGANDAPRLATDLLFVDVTTGDLFTFDVSGGRAVGVPGTNPDTGNATLLGVEKRDDGRWYIRSRHLPALAGFKDGAGAVLDHKTGEVRLKSEQARRGR